jgi:hypothetical protein
MGRLMRCAFGWWAPTGLPLPRRRTFAPAFQASAHSELTALRPSWAALVSYAGDVAGASPRETE